MKKIPKIVYFIKMFLFIIHFYFVFSMLHNILDAKIYGYIFLAFYFVYVIKVIIELLSKKKHYKKDTIYNFMQVGLMAYILIIAIRTNVIHMYVTKMTLPYFKINYSILSLLIIFIISYSFIEFKMPEDTKKRGDSNERKVSKVTK